MKTGISNARLGVLWLAAAGAFPVAAQTPSAQTVMVLPETVVTATRTPSRADTLISDVTVITREDIERATGRTLTELISRSGGINMTSNGGLGKASLLNIRGTEARHTLLLVDGVRYGSATLGAPNYDNIPLDTIERIEILKGPASALYGSDAVGGVVQIFTRQGKQGIHPYASLTAGEYDHMGVSTGLQSSSGPVAYAFGVQTTREKGFSSTNPRVAFNNFNPDTDGFNQTAVNASVGWTLTDGWKLSANALQSDGELQFDNGASAFDARSIITTNVYGLALEGKLFDRWKSRLSFGSSEDNSKNWTSNTPTRFDTQQDQWIWQNDVSTALGTFVLGYDNLNQTVSGTTAYTVTSRRIDGIFAGLTGSSGAHTWQINARRDDNSQFGMATTGLIGYGYKFTTDLRVHGSAGTTFKAPSFNALYFPGFGNATTQPETGKNAELGATYALGQQQFSVTRFVNRIQGFITTLPSVSSIPFARIEGWSLGYLGEAGAFSWRANLDFLDARNELTGLKLIRRPDQQFSASADYAVGCWQWGGSFFAAAQSFEDAANTQTLGGYGTVDVFTTYALAKDWKLEGRVVNVGDKFYQTAMGYNQPGRGAYVTLRYQPK